MSQKDNNFQPKPKRGGQKFNGRKEYKPEGRSFGERSERDRGDRPARPARSFDRDSRPPRDRDSGDRPAFKKRESAGETRRDYKPEARKTFGDRDSRPPRREGSSEARYKPEGRQDFGGKPFKKRSFGDKDTRPQRDRDSSDRPAFKKRESAGETRRDYKPEARKTFGDRDSRPPRRDFGDKPYKKREFGDKKPFNREKPAFDKFNSRPQKSYTRYDERPPRDDTRQKLKSDRPAYGAPSAAYLFGIHAVSQALLNPQRVHQRLLCTQKGHAALAEALSDDARLPEITYVEKEDLERLLPRDAVHQEVLLDCLPLEDIALLDLLATAPDNAKVLVLDQVTDPHNIGAILRSAAAFGAIAVVMQKLHAPDITGTLAKSASGAVEHVPIIREVNLSRALEHLKEAGFFCIGLDEDGKQPLAKLNPTGKIALVLGAEGPGLRRLVAENCDELVNLPTQGPIGSLNVSNAAAVALYELTRAG